MSVENTQHARREYMKLPKSNRTEVGCRVSWEYYSDRATAEQAVIAARHNARIDESLGFDFGFMCPGTMRQKGDEWEVCVS